MTRKYLRGYRTTQVTTHIQAPHYDALQRYMSAHDVRGGNGKVFEQALERLPGFKQLLREEQGAYETSNQANHQAIAKDESIA